MKITVLYFASLREAIGIERETVELPTSARTVGALREWLMNRAENASVLGGGRVRAAVNQTIALPDASIADGDEVAFFPPVTGG